MVPLQSSAEAVPRAASPSIANTPNSRRNPCAMARSSRWPSNDVPSYSGPRLVQHGRIIGQAGNSEAECSSTRPSKPPEDVTEDEQPGEYGGADQERQMPAHQHNEKQERGDDAREEIDGMVALRETTKKARDRDVIADERVGFVEQGGRRDQDDYPDDSLR